MDGQTLGPHLSGRAHRHKPSPRPRPGRIPARLDRDARWLLRLLLLGEAAVVAVVAVVFTVSERSRPHGGFEDLFVALAILLLCGCAIIARAGLTAAHPRPLSWMAALLLQGALAVFLVVQPPSDLRPPAPLAAVPLLTGGLMLVVALIEVVGAARGRVRDGRH